MRNAIIALATFVLASPAAAQAPSEGDFTVEITPSIERLGGSDCEEEATAERTLSVSLAGNNFGSTYSLRLTYGSTTQGCDEAETEMCPERTSNADALGGVGCRCITSEANATSMTATGSLEELSGIDNLCSLVNVGQDVSLHFVAIWEPDNADGSGGEGEGEGEADVALDTARSGALTIHIDRSGPPAGVQPPDVDRSEHALKITPTDRPNSDDIEEVEACVRTEVESGEVDLSVLSCESESAPAEADDFEPVKVAGLLNGNSYCAAYRFIDAAGNTGDFSPWSCGFTPEDLLDFAELYRERGGLETGGCSVSTGPTSALLVGFFAAAGLILRRRRR